MGNMVERPHPGIAGIQSIYVLDPYTKHIHSRIAICETGQDGTRHMLLFSTVTPKWIQPFVFSTEPPAEIEYSADLFVPVHPNPTVPKSKPFPFSKLTGHVLPAKLPQETSEMAATLRSEFIPSATHSWVATFMKNAQYRTKENEGGGDCFFAAIRDAMLEIGYLVSVDQLREIVAEEMPEESFRVQKQLHLDMMHEQTVLMQELRKFQTKADQLKTYIQGQQSASKQSGMDISESVKQKYNQDVELLKSQFQQTKQDLQTVNTHLSQSDSTAMSTIQTMDQYRAHIRTSNYWADEVTVLIVERRLNIKCIILSERNFKQSFLDGVLVCTPNPIESGGPFCPTHYIALSYSGTHYKQIMYKGRGIFSYPEIPFDLKSLIQNKCAENPSNGFSVIPEWSVHLPRDVTGGGFSERSTTPDILFVYHPMSTDEYPGQGTGEHIIPSTIPLFRALSKRTHWRRVLSDEYPCSIRMDSLLWPSVAHYLVAYPFRMEHKSFYQSFSSPHGKNAQFPPHELDLVMKTNADRIPQVTHPIAEETWQSIREMALMAKFTQNQPLAWTLLLTRNANLGKFKRKQSPELDHVLMKVRAQLLSRMVSK
jgi:hypothetical protein